MNHKLQLIISGQSPRSLNRTRYDHDTEDDPEIKKAIKDKYRTFTKWNLKDTFRVTQHKKMSSKKSNDSMPSQRMKLNLNAVKEKQSSENPKELVGELEGVKS